MKQVNVQEIKEKYPVGTRICLIHMDDKYSKIRKGDEGTVTGVDDAGQIQMCWDCGSGLSLIPDVDEFEMIPEPVLVHKAKECLEKYHAIQEYLTKSNGCELCDADTILCDVVENADCHIEGLGENLLEQYTALHTSAERAAFENLFELITGEPFGDFLDTVIEETNMPDTNEGMAREQFNALVQNQYQAFTMQMMRESKSHLFDNAYTIAKWTGLRNYLCDKNAQQIEKLFRYADNILPELVEYESKYATPQWTTWEDIDALIQEFVWEKEAKH